MFIFSPRADYVLNFFSYLNQTNISYVCWKNFSEIDRFFLAEKDIDLFIPLSQKQAFETFLGNFAYFKAEYIHSSYEVIEHYFVFDKDSGGFFHLHVYFQIITGNTWLKEYAFLIDSDEMLRNPEIYRDVKCVNQSLKESIFLARQVVKEAGLFNKLTALRDTADLIEEREFIGVTSDLNKPVFAIKSRLSKLDIVINCVKKIIKKCVCLIIYSNKRRLRERGLIIAVGGPDGSGKSTTVARLHKSLSAVLKTSSAHPGRLTKAKDEMKLETDSQSVFKAVRLAAVAMIRLQICLVASLKKSLKFVVIADRWPGMVHGTNDSPKIRASLSQFHRVLYFLENACYRMIPDCDVYLDLRVSSDQAIYRNKARSKVGKETDEQIAQRWKLYQQYKPQAKIVLAINSEQTINDTAIKCLFAISKVANNKTPI